MWKKVIAAVILISLLTVAIVQAVNKQSEKPDPASQPAVDARGGLKAGVKAPDFELKTLTGESVKLSDLKGKKVMLNFWATWCPPCKKEMPEMEQFYNESGDQITILAVNIDPQLDVQKFVDENKITFPVLLDEEDAVNETYQILTIPTTYFIDSKGIIQHTFFGSMTLDDMKEWTNKLK